MTEPTKSAEWTVDARRTTIDAAISHAISRHGLTMRPEGAGQLVLVGGSQVKTRLLGAWLGKDAWLPKRGTITLEGDGPTRVAVEMRDSMGFGVMDRGTRKKYDRILDSIVFSIGTAVQGLGGVASEPAGPDRVGELERLGTLHGSGTLTDEEFVVAKARILGS